MGEDEEEGEREKERKRSTGFQEAKDRWMQLYLLHKCKQLVASVTGQNP